MAVRCETVPCFLQYLYAFTIAPIAHLSSSELTQQPTDTTECPFKALQAEEGPFKIETIGTDVSCSYG